MATELGCCSYTLDAVSCRASRFEKRNQCLYLGKSADASGWVRSVTSGMCYMSIGLSPYV